MGWKTGLAVFAFILIVGFLLHMHFVRVFDVKVFEKKVFNKVNEVRVKHGLKRLKWNSALYEAAKHHAEWMAEHGLLQHREEDVRFRNPWNRAWYYGFRSMFVGENIYFTAYFGSEETIAEETVEAWLESPKHRENMLNPAYMYAAVAAAKTEEGIYVVLLLGR